MTTWSKIVKFFQEKRIRLSLAVSIPLLLLFSFLITYGMFRLAPGLIQDFQAVADENPMLYTLNYLPVLSLLLFLYFLTNNAVFSAALSTTVFFSMSFINRMKIELRQDPFLPTDLSLATEITSLLDKFNASFVQTVLLIVFAAAAALLISGLFFGGKPFPIKIRGICLAVVVLVSIGVNAIYYQDGRLYDSFPIDGNYYFKVNHFEAKGFLYSFLREYNTRKVVKPDGYHKNTYASLEESFSAPAPSDEMPNIIMIMGEAFSDLSENPNISFDGYTDPLKYYKTLSADENAVSGHIIVPNFGGGTSDTEFDALSACPTVLIENSLPSYSFIHTAFDALPNRLKSMGYDTIAIHPGNSWFYNRKNVYEYMGFDDFLYLEKDFDLATQNIAGYISEEATYDKIISIFEEHQSTSDAPLFEFCVTIQNHGPYTDKYGLKESFHSNIPLLEEETNMLSNYFRGTEDADRELNRLVDYFRQSGEPTVIVYFGDHLPGFPEGLDLFAKLDYPIDIEGSVAERVNLYKTPFLIWQNDAAKELSDFSETVKSAALPEERTINASYLGALVMELMGYPDLSPLYSYSNALRKELPVISQQGYMDKNSAYYETLSAPELQNKVQFLKGWVYYKLFDEK